MSSPAQCAFDPADEDTPRGYSLDCQLDAWAGSSEGLCILHAHENPKPHDILQQAISEQTQPVVNASLNDIKDGSDLDFSGAELPGADFSNSSLRGVSFEDAFLKSANFVNSDLSSAKFIEDADLTGADFTDAYCIQTKFSKSTISYANFVDSTIIGGHLSYTKARRADFTDAEITDTSLFQSDLRNVDFIDAEIGDCAFQASNLSKADFSGATVSQCSLVDAKLTETRLANATLDQRNEYGRRLLSEYQADRLAEPNFLVDLFELPRVDELGFGVESKRPPGENQSDRGITDSPPDSPFERVSEQDYWWWKSKSLAISRFFPRLFGQFKSYASIVRSGSRLDSSDQQDLLSAAENTYSEIKSAYRGSAWSNLARNFNIREKEARKKKLSPLRSWFQDALLYRSMRHGESPGQVFKIGLLLWILATFLFLHLGISTGTQTTIHLSLSWDLNIGLLGRSLLFSLRRLFTFSNGGYELLRGQYWATALSIVGALLEAALVFTLGRRAVA
ncbi:pentapeptide repeat-containing protein [Halobacterium wangiae]|uniref:pentapeptide repeat-containing protein n=1 Tax=Halobacterium wangiae TaxID=2902623 RepID=UPI001E3623F9|nr:pentapeptide repeat-containing protein [Halobacterium wangiae]